MTCLRLCLLTSLTLSAALLPLPVLASDPAMSEVTLPTSPGATVVVEWTGTALPGGSGLGSTGGIADASQPCPSPGPDDTHVVNLTVPDGAYDAVNVAAEFHIEWEEGSPDPSGSFTDPDLVLSVYQDGTLVGSSDGGSPQENVGINNPTAGSYTAVACPFLASAPTAYRGRLTLTALEPAACVDAPSKARAHSTVFSAGSGLKDQELRSFANFDRYGVETATRSLAVPEGFDGRQQAPLYDRALGLPTFLWAPKNTEADAVGPLSARELLIERARAHLRREAKHLKLSAAAIDAAEVHDAQFNGNGPAVVRFRQIVDGLPVHHRSLNVLLDRGHRPVAVSGYFAPSTTPAPAFTQSGAQAVAAAWTHLGGQLLPDALSPLETRGGWDWYATPALSGSHVFERAPRVRRVYYPRASGLEPAYQVELFATARANRELIAYALVISAVDGQILHRKNLKSEVAFTYRTFADDAAPFTPDDSPLGNSYTPFPGSTPTETLLRSGGATRLVTLEHAGIKTGDPWLAEDATTTIGNHVEACIDNFDTPLSGIISNPLNTCDPELGDEEPPTTAPQTFDYAIAPDEDPSNANARLAAAVSLFYTINWQHDWWYNHGFDEVAGNAQTLNYGRGGIEGDPLIAQGQDASGRNNANMATPSDGSSPTMQQYLFDGPAIGEVRLTAPVESGPLKFAAAGFGPDDYELSAELALADDIDGDSATDGCGAAPVPNPGLPAALPSVPATPQASLAGKIALIDRGNCNFTAKAQFAQLSGAVGMIVVNNTDGEPIVMGNGDLPVSGVPLPVDATGAIYQVPSVMIRKADGEALKAQLAVGAATVRMQREPSIDVDGTLDNQIVAHEYFHYVHHRLTDSSNQQARAMSEGWGDINGFMLGLRADERALAGNGLYQGAYGIAGYSVNNFFAGIRRAPYSTDFTKNAFTFKHIADGEPTPDGGAGATNSAVHSSGEIWANAMFGCYVNLLNDPRHSFAEAQSRMQDYIIGGFKMTPADATYTEARDAVLSVVLASDFDDYRACSAAFATRGMGLNAIAPARSSVDHVGVVEDFTPFVCKAATGGGGIGGGGDAGRFGSGALGLGLLLPLLGSLLLRRRSAGAENY